MALVTLNMLSRCSKDRWCCCVQTFELMQKSQKPLIKEHVMLMHGQMAGEQKQLVLDTFKQGSRRLLISTVIIEVGIDMPDATLMVVEHSELHQLRGRVGRSSKQSACVLVTASKQAIERLQVLEVCSKTTACYFYTFFLES
jgi:ATP-dependent DNA helicase RecG